MKLGMHLYELWRLRLGLVLSLVFALLVSLTSAYRISLFPPGLQPRALSMSAASTHVLIDNPKSILLNGVGSDELANMSQRALLLGNVMASIPVREYIARRAGVPEQVIQMSSPLTPQYPRPIANDPQNEPSTTDLLRSNHQYRIDVESNPTVPILDIYTAASDIKTADALANAAVNGLRDYLAALDQSAHVPADQQVRLEQLGPARGGSVTGGVNFEVAALVFLFVFVLSSIASLVIARAVRGWRLSAEARRLATAHTGTNGSVRSHDGVQRAFSRQE